VINKKRDYIKVYNFDLVCYCMKPVYLVDLVLDKIHELKHEKRPKTIGRDPNCDYATSLDNRFVSRLQGEIVYRGNQILFRQISENSKTFIGTKDNPYETQVFQDVTEEVQIGNFITMGNNYFFEVRSFRQVKSQLDEIQDKINEDTVRM